TEIGEELRDLQAEYRELNAQNRILENNIHDSANKISRMEQSLTEMATKNHQLAAEKIEIEEKLQLSEARRRDAEASVARVMADTDNVQSGKKELEIQLTEVQA